MSSTRIERTAGGTALRLVAVLLAILIAVATFPATAHEEAKIQKTTLALQISTPEGSYFINLFGQSDGPVGIPVQSEQISAIQVSTRFEEGEVLRVAVSSVVDDLPIEPIGMYQLSLPEGAAQLQRSYLLDVPLKDDLVSMKDQQTEEIPIHELSAVGLNGWTFKITTYPPFLLKNCACCSCSSLYCCPHAGQCMGCGGCGDCCCAGGGGEPPGDPENQN